MRPAGQSARNAFFKIYYSNDNGAVWHECTKAGHRLPNTTYVALNPHQPGHFWVATNGRSYARFTPGAMGEWQQQYFSSLSLNDPMISSATADPDGDGQSNDFEFTAGLSPLDPQSRFVQAMQNVPGQPAQRQIQISPRLAGRTYIIESSPTLGLSANWQTLTNFTTSDVGNIRTITDLSATGAAKFYRVRITVP